MYHKLGTKLLYIYSKVNNAKVDAKNLCGMSTRMLHNYGLRPLIWG